MRAVVTGGTGFLGGHLARALLVRGDRVCILGRNIGVVADLVAQGAEAHAVDLCDRSAVIAACAGADVVFHAGARTSDWGSRTAFFAVNVGGTAAVIEGCRRHAVSRLVYVSSPAVVFDGHDQCEATERLPYPVRFASTYALTKKLGEELVKSAQDVPSVIVRPKAIFGPGDRALLPRLLAAARKGRLRQFGDGRNCVDLTYVENVVHALLLAAEVPAAIGNCYFITNDVHVPLWPTLRRVLAALGYKVALPAAPVALALAAAALMEARAAVDGREPLLTRYGVAVLARTQTYDIAAARCDLGYSPVVSIEAGIERTIAAWRSIDQAQTKTDNG